MKNNRLLAVVHPALFFVVLALFVCLQMVTADAALAAYSFKVGHESAPGSMQDQFANKFKEYVERESKGEITVSVFPSDQIGDPFALLQGVQSGVIELGIFNGGSIATVLKDYALFSVPTLLPKEQEKTRQIFAPGSPFVKIFTRDAEKTGIKHIGSYIEPFFQVTANKKIEKAEDFNGLKIRTMNSPIIIATYRALGANPTPIPFSEVYSGLQTRLIDAQENPLDIIHEMSFFEVQKFLMLTNHSTVINSLYVGDKTFASLPANLQDIVIKGGTAAQEFMFSEVANIEKRGLEALKKTGKITLVEGTKSVSDAYSKASSAARAEVLQARRGAPRQGVNREPGSRQGETEIAMVLHRARRGVHWQGGEIGVIVLDEHIPRVPGSVCNTMTFPFPVRYCLIEGATVDLLVREQDSHLENLFVSAALRLQGEGACAVVGSCGFMALFQKAVADALSIPVLLSSLMQLPAIEAMLPARGKIGVLTAFAPSLTPRLLAAAGVGTDYSRLCIYGLEGGNEANAALLQESGELDSDILEQEVLAVTRKMMAENGDIAAILLECSELPPYSAAVKLQTGLPVFDFVTMIDNLHASLSPRRFTP